MTGKRRKYAVISMDVEDWYHNDYFLSSSDVDKSYHMLDGIDVLADILKKNDIRGTLFVLSEILGEISGKIAALDEAGNEIACHGNTHVRPVELDIEEYRQQLTQAKAEIESVIGHKIVGYRAPTYGLDNAHMQVIRNLGFRYDSSKNAFAQNPKYGRLDLTGFAEPAENIYTDGELCEFEISTQDFMGYKLPLGGGYLRMLPWPFNKWQLKKYADSGKFYVLYIHPFELSAKKVPHVRDAGFKNRIRSTLGRRRVAKKVDKVIRYMKSRGYEFVTFGQLRQFVLEGAKEGK